MKKEQIEARGPFRLHSCCWTPEDGPPRAVIQLVHGMSEYINRYDDFACFLAGQGFLVFGCDLPGHGQSVHSEADFGYFADEDGWQLVTSLLQELALEVKQAYPLLPFFLFGHSMGSFLVRTLMIDAPQLADGYLLSGTAQPDPRLLSSGLRIMQLPLHRSGPRARNARVERLSMGAFNQHFAPARTASDWISRDSEMVDRHAADPLCSFFPTVSLFRDMAVGLQYIAAPENLARMDPQKPIFLLSGDEDPVGERGEGVLRVFASFLRLGCPHVHLKLYPGGRHEMLNETNRQEVYEDILAWLTKHSEVTHALS